MKNYTITVNGNVYDVTVEETGSTPSVAYLSTTSRWDRKYMSSLPKQDSIWTL